MNRIPSHDELREDLPAAALEILEDDELERVLLHARECAECALQLDEYRAVAARLASQLPARAMHPDRSSALRSRLVGRAFRERPPTRRPLRQAAILQWTGWLVAAGFAGVLLVHHSIHRPLDYGWLFAGVLLIGLVGLSLYARSQRKRAAALEDRLRSLERDGPLLDHELEP